MQTNLLSAGAARGLVEALQRQFTATTRCDVSAYFGAVGAVVQRLREGAPCDVIIVTAQQVRMLGEQGKIIVGSSKSLGHVATGIATMPDSSIRDIHDEEHLKGLLVASNRIYFPDPKKATAGIHFSKVLAKLGIEDEVRARLRPHPNGTTAMHVMAVEGNNSSIGCTQVSEILAVPGVRLVGPLPANCALSTEYVAAVATGARNIDFASGLIECLCSPLSMHTRKALGFEIERSN